MSEKSERAKIEQEVHLAAKQAITDRQSASYKALFGTEGASEALIIAITAFLYKILVLVLIPDITWSKVLAAILAIGVGLYIAYKAIEIITKSLDDLVRIRGESAAAEIAEDSRYTQAIERIYT